MSVFARTFEVMMVGRVLQGIGVAGPRVVTMALVRDQYEGRQMARLMSFATSLFILVPTIAPALGQGIQWLAGWRAHICVVFRHCRGRLRLVRGPAAGNTARFAPAADVAALHRQRRD